MNQGTDTNQARVHVVKGDEGYWSNKIGWVFHLSDATRFTKSETRKLRLPIGDNVQWERVSDNMICRHCNRTIENDRGIWVDPEATGDDSIWRETCDSNDTFTAEHEPMRTEERTQ